MPPRPYSFREKKEILEYIIARDAFHRLRGASFWKEYEDSGVTNRTWQSLKQAFKCILKDIRNPYYKLSENLIALFENRISSNNSKLDFVSKESLIGSSFISKATSTPVESPILSKNNANGVIQDGNIPNTSFYNPDPRPSESPSIIVSHTQTINSVNNDAGDSSSETDNENLTNLRVCYKNKLYPLYVDYVDENHQSHKKQLVATESKKPRKEQGSKRTKLPIYIDDDSNEEGKEEDSAERWKKMYLAAKAETEKLKRSFEQNCNEINSNSTSPKPNSCKIAITKHGQDVVENHFVLDTQETDMVINILADVRSEKQVSENSASPKESTDKLEGSNAKTCDVLTEMEVFLETLDGKSQLEPAVAEENICEINSTRNVKSILMGDKDDADKQDGNGSDEGVIPDSFSSEVNVIVHDLLDVEMPPKNQSNSSEQEVASNSGKTKRKAISKSKLSNPKKRLTRGSTEGEQKKSEPEVRRSPRTNVSKDVEKIPNLRSQKRTSEKENSETYSENTETLSENTGTLSGASLSEKANSEPSEDSTEYVSTTGESQLSQKSESKASLDEDHLAVLHEEIFVQTKRSSTDRTLILDQNKIKPRTLSDRQPDVKPSNFHLDRTVLFQEIPKYVKGYNSVKKRHSGDRIFAEDIEPKDDSASLRTSYAVKHGLSNLERNIRVKTSKDGDKQCDKVNIDAGEVKKYVCAKKISMSEIFPRTVSDLMSEDSAEPSGSEN